MSKKVFNLEELKSGSRRATTPVVSLEYIIRDMSLYDTNPPYQRGRVWKRDYEMDLFESILEGIPIGAFHLVKKSSGVGYWVLDAKQRLSTIKNFVNNKFSIVVKDKNGNLNNVYWRDIQNPLHFSYFLCDRINMYQVSIVMWEYMDFNDQKEVFQRVNNSVALTGWEKMYGEQFLAKNFMTYIFDNQFLPVRKYLNNNLNTNHRFTGIKLVNSLLVYAFGYHFNETFGARSMCQDAMIESCKFLEEQLLKQGVDANFLPENYSVKLIEDMGLEKNINLIKCCCNWFDICMKMINNLDKKNKLDGNTILDTVAFFIKKVQDGILTNSYAQQNMDKMSLFVKNWIIEKTRRGLKQRSTADNSIKDRIKVMEEVFLQSGLDNSVKCRRISDIEKTIAALSSGKVDPISGVIIDESNAQFDHVKAASISGKTEIRVISAESNRRKSDISLETFKKMEDYVEKSSGI